MHLVGLISGTAETHIVTSSQVRFVSCLNSSLFEWNFRHREIKNLKSPMSEADELRRRKVISQDKRSSKKETQEGVKTQPIPPNESPDAWTLWVFSRCLECDCNYFLKNVGDFSSFISFLCFFMKYATTQPSGWISSHFSSPPSDPFSPLLSFP